MEQFKQVFEIAKAEIAEQQTIRTELMSHKEYGMAIECNEYIVKALDLALSATRGVMEMKVTNTMAGNTNSMLEIIQKHLRDDKSQPWKDDNDTN